MNAHCTTFEILLVPFVSKQRLSLQQYVNFMRIVSKQERVSGTKPERRSPKYEKYLTVMHISSSTMQKYSVALCI